MLVALQVRLLVRNAISWMRPSTSTSATTRRSNSGVLLARLLGLQANQVIAQDRSLGAALDLALNAGLHVVLGPSHPEDAASREIGQMAKVHVSLVKHDDFALANVRADFPGPLIVVLFGGVDDGKAGQETLEVEPQMAFGGSLAAAMFGPVHAVGDQLDRGGVDNVNHALEAPSKTAVAVGAREAPGNVLEMIERFVEEFLRRIQLRTLLA